MYENREQMSKKTYKYFIKRKLINIITIFYYY